MGEKNFFVKFRLVSPFLTTHRKIDDLIVTMAQRGVSPSQICQNLRDKHGLLSLNAASINNNKLVRLLKCKGLMPALPEYLHAMCIKLKTMKNYMAKNNNDHHIRFYYINQMCKTIRAVRHGKKTQIIAPNFALQDYINELQV